MCFSNYSDKKVIINASDCNALIDLIEKNEPYPESKTSSKRSNMILDYLELSISILDLT